MLEKRNIVIKIIYPAHKNAVGKSAPTVITEWNIKRILLAACVLVLTFATLFYVINFSEQKTELDSLETQTAAIENPAPTPIEAPQSDINSPDLSKPTNTPISSLAKSIDHPNKKNNQTTVIKKVISKQSVDKIGPEEVKTKPTVAKALLTYGISRNNQPASEITRTLTISPKKAIWVNYSTELKAMKGRKIYHEWQKNGVVISKQPLTIPSNYYQAASRKLMSDASTGKWSVKLIDSNGRLLNEKKFNVK